LFIAGGSLAGSSEFALPGVNAAKNWLSGSTYDQNGNVTTLNNATLSYDVENRLSEYTTGSFVENYGYDEANRRVDRWSGTTYDNVYFYGPNGKLLTVVQLNFNPTAPYVTASTLSNRIYFGKMLLGTTNGQVNTDSSLIKDRLGSVQPSYPYGTATGSGEQTSPGDDFATYWKDSSTGFEYAVNRYYSTGYGRFLTVDPSSASGKPGSPVSWNRYGYGSGDPINGRDPSGLDAGDDGGDGDDPPYSCNLFNGCMPPCLAFDGSGLDGSWYSASNIAIPGLNEAYCDFLPVLPILPFAGGGGGTCSAGPGWDPRCAAMAKPCDLEMHTRLTRGVPGALGASHQYLTLDDPYTRDEWTVEGARDKNATAFGSLGALVARETENGVGYPDDHPSTDAVFGGKLLIPCGEIGVILADAKSFIPTAYEAFGPNSNSFMHWLIEKAGLGFYYPLPPPGAVGWYTPIGGQANGGPLGGP
jgi:RHS repeat-associated protein